MTKLLNIISRHWVILLVVICCCIQGSISEGLARFIPEKVTLVPETEQGTGSEVHWFESE
jgi:hypothetical protein